MKRVLQFAYHINQQNLRILVRCSYILNVVFGMCFWLFLVGWDCLGLILNMQNWCARHAEEKSHESLPCWAHLPRVAFLEWKGFTLMMASPNKFFFVHFRSLKIAFFLHISRRFLPSKYLLEIFSKCLILEVSIFQISTLPGAAHKFFHRWMSCTTLLGISVTHIWLLEAWTAGRWLSAWRIIPGRT